MRDADEVARESLGNIAGPLRHIFGDAEWLDALDVLIAQEAEHLSDLIRAREAEIAEKVWAEALAGFFTEERARFWEHDEGTGRLRRATTGVVHRRLVGPWEPVEREGGASE